MKVYTSIPPPQSSRPALARQLWLNYFNDYLREQNVITDDEWRRMKRRIQESRPKKDA